MPGATLAADKGRQKRNLRTQVRLDEIQENLLSRKFTCNVYKIARLVKSQVVKMTEEKK